jgi:hypothetical protein
MLHLIAANIVPSSLILLALIMEHVDNRTQNLWVNSQEF